VTPGAVFGRPPALQAAQQHWTKARRRAFCWQQDGDLCLNQPPSLCR
jgi:hypothetical protein